MCTRREPLDLDWLHLGVARHAREINILSLLAYRREAELIGATNFPPLREQPGDISKSHNQFYAATQGGQLCGVVEVITVEACLELSRLVVGDQFLRCGVASFMLNKLISENPGCPWRVDTAEANGPALALYANFDFVEVRHWTSPEGYKLVGLDRVNR